MRIEKIPRPSVHPGTAPKADSKDPSDFHYVYILKKQGPAEPVPDAATEADGAGPSAFN